jgi:hypothetical protein
MDRQALIGCIRKQTRRRRGPCRIVEKATLREEARWSVAAYLAGRVRAPMPVKAACAALNAWDPDGARRLSELGGLFLAVATEPSGQRQRCLPPEGDNELRT